MPEPGIAQKKEKRRESSGNVLGRVIGLAVVVAVASVIGLALALLGAWVARVIWPDDVLIIDETVIKMAELLAWPTASIVIASMLIFSADLLPAIASLLRRFSGLKAGGYEFSFSAEGAERLKRDMEKELAQYFDQAKAAYDREVRVHRVYDAISDALEAVRSASVPLSLPSTGGIRPGHLKGTVHVLDVGIEETLYQLTEYVPSASGPRGRRYSIRYGAIGLAWRTAKPHAWNPNVGQDRQELVVKWGMTTDEASSAMGKGFAMCVPLSAPDGTMLGVLYMQSDDLKKITKAEKVEDQEKQIGALLKTFGEGDVKKALDRLSSKIAAVLNSVKDRGVFLNIHD
jgi:hypothetical protein